MTFLLINYSTRESLFLHKDDIEEYITDVILESKEYSKTGIHILKDIEIIDYEEYGKFTNIKANVECKESGYVISFDLGF